MGGCLSNPKVRVQEPEQEEKKAADIRSSTSLKSFKTTRTDLAKFLLKFPKIKQAYKHLFNGWCQAIGKSVNEGATVAQIFNLEGPIEKASAALALAGIVSTNETVLTSLAQEIVSPRPNKESLRFKDLIISVCGMIKRGGDGLKMGKEEGDETKYNEIMNGFNIVKEMFAQIDVDGSGEISLKEFAEAFSDLNHGDDSGIHEKRMRELDFNNDQQISYPEFCVGLSVWVGFAQE